MDGVTATATELNLIDGVTSTTAELHIMDGVTATAAELNTMDGVTATTAELNVLDGALKENNSIWIGNNPTSSTNGAIYSVAIGTIALDAITTGDNNVAIGYNALTDNTSGEANTAIGLGSLVANTTGIHNTAIGTYSLTTVTTGIRNTAIGSGSGANLNGATSNTTLVGYNCNASNYQTYNEIVIGADATGLGGNKAVIGNSQITDLYAAQDGDAWVYGKGFLHMSDRRVKKEIRDLDYGLNYVKSLRPVSYYKKDPAKYPKVLQDALYSNGDIRELTEEEKMLNVGFIAQEVKQVNDEMGLENNVVMVDEVGFHRMDYEKIVVPLVKAVQEQQEQIEGQQSEIDILRSQYAQVMNQNQELIKLVSTQLLKNGNDANVEPINSDSNSNDEISDESVTSMK